MPSMTNEDLCKTVASLVKDCEHYREDQSVYRTRAMEYFDGTMNDTPSDDGRSKVVSRDVRAELKKIMPSIVRVILGGDKVVEYQPVGEGDEQGAQQATDYVNILAFPESEGPDAVHDAIYDALLLRNGVLKWWQDEKIDVKVSTHSGLDEAAFTQLVASDDVEVLEHTATPGQVEIPGQGVMPALFHDVKIRRKIKKRRPKMGAVPLDNFLIHPDATSILNSPITGEGYRLRRSDLVAMGYDREKIENLPVAGSAKAKDEEETTRRRDIFNKDQQTAKAMEEVEYWELLVRIDYDDDGIAELRRIVFAGKLSEEGLLENTEWDEVNYADIVCERRPHQWEGNSTSDDSMEIQRIKTVLLRQTLDNLYWQNNQQPIAQEGAIVNPEAVTNPTFGLPIRVQSGIDIRAALGYNQVPFVADKSFGMLEYLDQELHDRTGISDASGGLAPDALQNMTAKASAMIEQAGIGQTEMMVRTIANCLKPAFRGLLKLIIQHQDQPRTVRLRGNWVQFDPRTWNVDMDATVNTGLGAGTRERDMMMMQIVREAQKEIIAALGMDNPIVKPNQFYNGVSKMVEAAGLKSVDQYFTSPSPPELQEFAAKQAQKPTEAQEKAQAAVMVEQAKGQVQLALKDKDIAKEANKEREQRNADLVIKQAELERDTQNRAQEVAAEDRRFEQEMAIKREEIASKERIEAAKLNAQMTMKMAATNPDGTPAEGAVNSDQFAELQQQMASGFSELARLLTAPKVLIRDEQGRPIGAQTVLPEMNGADQPSIQ